ncbi:MAG: hypothetical protein EXS15_02120 [Phycisphaerales bacterium]|nr:hypothetical protein [Phycisphaerales bacterium]
MCGICLGLFWFRFGWLWRLLILCVGLVLGFVAVAALRFLFLLLLWLLFVLLWIILLVLLSTRLVLRLLLLFVLLFVLWILLLLLFLLLLFLLLLFLLLLFLLLLLLLLQLLQLLEQSRGSLCIDSSIKVCRIRLRRVGVVRQRGGDCVDCTLEIGRSLRCGCLRIGRWCFELCKCLAVDGISLIEHGSRRKSSVGRLCCNGKRFSRSPSIPCAVLRNSLVESRFCT